MNAKMHVQGETGSGLIDAKVTFKLGGYCTIDIDPFPGGGSYDNLKYQLSSWTGPADSTIKDTKGNAWKVHVFMAEH